MKKLYISGGDQKFLYVETDKSACSQTPSPVWNGKLNPNENESKTIISATTVFHFPDVLVQFCVK